MIERFKKNWLSSTIFIVLILLCVWMICVNHDNEDFLNADLIDIIPMILGLVIAVCITEYMNDQRRRNDCIEHIIMEIEAFVSDDTNFTIQKNTLIKQGSCANRIKYLKDAKFQDISSDMDFIEKSFSNIRDLYSNHSSSAEALEAVKIDIDKHRDQIVDKCSKIRVGLYSK